MIGNAPSCRTVETASTVSTKYARLSEKHEWDSRQYPRVNAHTQPRQKFRVLDLLHSLSNFTLSTVFRRRFPLSARLSLSSSRKGRWENKLNPPKEEFSPLLVSLTKNRRTVYIYNINAGTFYPPQTVQKMSGSELIRDFLLKERVCYSRLVKDLLRHF